MSGATGLILEQDCTWVDFLLTRKKKERYLGVTFGISGAGSRFVFSQQTKEKMGLGRWVR